MTKIDSRQAHASRVRAARGAEGSHHTRERPEIVCIGEVLWDALPDGIYLGGTVFNVAYHLCALGHAAWVATSVGQDRLGDEVLSRMSRNGMSSGLVQRDTRLETGFVSVNLAEAQSPRYEIVAPVAWDAISTTPALVEACSQADAVVFGTLAQRSGESRDTIQRVVRDARKAILDVNLRPPHVHPDIVATSLRLADIVKLSRDELGTLASWWNGPSDMAERMEWLTTQWNLDTVCVTLGAEGAVLRAGGTVYQSTGVTVRTVDAVGAGDGFLAGLVSALSRGRHPEEALERANSLGAFVASHAGATPPHGGFVQNQSWAGGGPGVSDRDPSGR